MLKKPIKEIAEWCDCTRQTVKAKLDRYPALEGQRQGKFVLYETLPALLRVLGINDEKLDPGQEKAKLDRLRAEKAELDLRIARNELIPVEQARDLWAKHITEARSKFLSLPVKVAPRVIGKESTLEIKQILEDAIYDALAGLADTDGAQTVGAAPEADSQSVGEPIPASKS